MNNETSNTVPNKKEDKKESTMGQSILKNAFALAVFAIITAGVIAVVQFNTQEKINKNVAEAQARALYEITPKHTVDNDLLSATLDLTSHKAKESMNINVLGDLPSGASAHFAQKDGKVHTVIFPAISPNGYTTDIHMVVGIKLDGSLAGVRIIKHKETPGLGDKVETKKSDWVHDFAGKSLTNPARDNWKVKKDGGIFDQFTGATITPRAVVGAVHQTLEFFANNKQQLLNMYSEQDQNKPHAMEVTP